MRVLLASSLGGAGHLVPVAAIGQRLAVLGHDTVVLVPPSLEQGAAATGLRVVVGDEPARDVVDGLRDRMAAGPPSAVAGLIDRELFADRCTEAMLPAARGLVASFGPDLVLREPCEYASAIAAAELGVGFATVAISAARLELDVLTMVTPILTGFAPQLATTIRGAPFLTALPELLDFSPWPLTLRYRVPEPSPAPLPDWWEDPRLPLVYATFGSVVGHTNLAPRVFGMAIAALGDLGARVLLTVGRTFDPAALGPLPPNVHVEQWVEQRDALGACDVVVCHGGSGTTFGSLAAGVPLVICPLYADNARNASMVEACGAGRAIARPADAGDAHGGDAATVASLRDALTEVLGDDRFRAAATRIAEASRAHPAVEDVISGALHA